MCILFLVVKWINKSVTPSCFCRAFVFSAHLSVNACLKRSKHEKQKKQTTDNHLVLLRLPFLSGLAFVTVSLCLRFCHITEDNKFIIIEGKRESFPCSRRGGV